MLQSTEVMREKPARVATPTVQVRVADPVASHATAPCIVTSQLTAYFGDVAAIKDVTMSIPQQAVTAIIGPWGAASRRCCGA